MKLKHLSFTAFIFITEASSDGVRLGAFDREPFSVSCQYEVYYQYEHLSQLIKSNVLFVSSGIIVFEHYNVLTARYESKENDSGDAVPKGTNRLEAKKFLLHYQKKYKPYPYSVVAINQFNESVYIPSDNDTHNQINIVKILRYCPNENEIAEGNVDAPDIESTALALPEIEP